MALSDLCIPKPDTGLEAGSNPGCLKAGKLV